MNDTYHYTMGEIDVMDVEGFEDPLYRACKTGDLETILNNRSRNLQVTFSNDWYKRTPLHIAAQWGQLVVVKYLIEEKGCSTECKDNDGWTPLHHASSGGRLEVVKYLIEEAGCSTECKANDGWTPLHHACRWKYLEVAYYLIEKAGCSTECKDNDGWTPLHHACRGGRLEVVKCLIEEAGCSTECKDNNGWTPLHHACWGGHLEVVKYLIEKAGCSTECKDNDGETPLHHACRGGRLEVVKYLIEKAGCSTECKDNDGETPLHHACRWEYLEVANYLIEKAGCSTECKDNDGWTPLHHACRGGHLKVVNYLIEKAGCSTECKDNDGWTPLHRACGGGRLKVVKYLIEKAGCSTECKDNIGETPLHHACRGGRLEVVKYLIGKAGCSTECKDNIGETPLHRACRGGRLEVVKYLIEKAGCSTECKDSNGETPLHHACREGRHKVIKYLVKEARADVNVPAKDGGTPLDVAPLQTVQFLLKCGAKPNYENWSRYLSSKADHPAHSTFKVFVLGDPAAGKSSLTTSLQLESKGLSRILNWVFKVGGVDKKTAGIVPHEVFNDKFGRVTVYDFAGHKEFYSGHDAVLRDAVAGSRSALFLIIVDLQEEDGKFKSTLLYWLGFVENQYASEELKPYLIIVGSHADRVKGADLNRKRALVRSMDEAGSFEKFQKADELFFTLDCRYAESSSLTRLRSTFSDICKSIQHSQDATFQSHWYLVYLLDRFRLHDALRLGDLLSKSSRELQVPQDVHSIADSCEQLNAHGNLLFLKSRQSLENSWIILNKTALLSRVYGSIFAPKGFVQHREFATITGVVVFSELGRQFSDLNPDLIADLLCHLEFCHEVTDPEILSLLQAGDSVSSSPKERYFFFPALVSLDMPKGVWEPSDTFTYHAGWLLQCSKPEQFLTPRFLHVLLLRLTFLFTLVSTAPQPPETPSILRRCSVWKNGISWVDRSGVRVLVEVADQKRVILLLRCRSMNEMALVRVRSSIIQKALSTKKEFCPKVEMQESFLQPRDAIQYPLDLSSLKTISMTELSKAIVEGSQFAVHHTGEEVVIDELLLFEPYAGVGRQILSELFDRQQPNYHDDISEEFFYRMADKVHQKKDNFIAVFGTSLSRLEELIGAMAHPGRTQEFVRVFVLWKEGQEESSRNTLRSHLDQFSVFAGRNPLEMSSATSPE